MIMEMHNGVASGKMNVLDYLSRLQRMMNRGTNGADLNNALEAGEDMLLRVCMHMDYGDYTINHRRASLSTTS